MTRTRQTALRTGALSLSLLAAMLHGCDAPGHTRYADWSEFRDADGSFSVRYPDPPWVVSSFSPGAARLIAKSDVFGLNPSDGSNEFFTYELQISLLSEAAEQAVRAKADSAETRGEVVAISPRPAQSYFGESGWEVFTRTSTSPAAFFRYVVFDRAVSGSVLLTLRSIFVVDDMESDALVFSLDADPEGR